MSAGTARAGGLAITTSPMTRCIIVECASAHRYPVNSLPVVAWTRFLTPLLIQFEISYVNTTCSIYLLNVCFIPEKYLCTVM